MTAPPATENSLIIRWLIRRDMEEVVEIERRSFEFPWADEEFLACLRQRNTIGSVVEATDDGLVYGFMIYELYKGMLRIVNLAVSPEVRRTGVGTAMIDRLKEKLNRQHRTQIKVEISEYNLNGQMFFAHLDFQAVRCVTDHFENGDGMIEFQYNRVPEWQGVNRISE